MNIVLDEAAEVYVKDVKPRRELGLFPFSSQAPALTRHFYRTYPAERR